LPNANGGQAATLNDVARLANVSRQTVSRVINNKASVSPDTERRVRAAIAELDYRPNSHARSLVTNRSLVLGLVVPSISQPYYPEVARGVEDGAYEADYSVFLSHTAGDPVRELRALERFRDHRVDGVIICNSRLDDETLTQALAALSPVVLVNRRVPYASGTVIWMGYESGTLLAIDHLVSLGRRRIGYLGYNYPNAVDATRFRGYRIGLERAGIPFDPALVFRGVSSFHGGYDAMAAFHATGVQIDGLFASNDMMGIGAMRFSLTNGIDVPGKLAIVGFGGSEVASMVTPDLTTVSMPLYLIGKTAVQELLQLLNGTSEQHRQLNIEPEILVRGSSVASMDSRDLQAPSR
jgi:LacI family transcriptional regulator